MGLAKNKIKHTVLCFKLKFARTEFLFFEMKVAATEMKFMCSNWICKTQCHQESVIDVNSKNIWLCLQLPYFDLPLLNLKWNFLLLRKS